MAYNPYEVVGSPSYSAPLVDLFGAAKSGMGLGQSLRQGANKLGDFFKPQWPQPGQQGQGVPYADVSMPGSAGPQPNPNVAPYVMQSPQARVDQGFQAMGQGGRPPLYTDYLQRTFGIGLPQTPPQSPGAQSPTQWSGRPVPYTNFDFMNG